jgi:hypothetical protein
MPNYNTPNAVYPSNYNSINNPQQPPNPPQYFPYNNNNNMLLNNNQYDPYMGNRTVAPMNQYLKCKPVSSKEEAKACQIDLDGSLNVFTDIGHGRIYTKQINNDGTATFKTYAVTKEEDPNESSKEYITRDEFNKVIQSLMAAMQSNNQEQIAPNNNENNNKLNSF